MKNLDEQIAAFVALNTRACQAQADWDDESRWPTDGVAEEAYIDELKARRAETLQQLCDMPSPIPALLCDKISWLTRLTNDEEEIGKFCDGRLQKMAASIAKDYERLHLVAHS